ncbi:hypothetical protein ACFVVQ_12255 [Paenibacillus chitinolyticus]|uniref:hypothetical protein n=1 Tax=Paenibacillus chitinolyticus TaxID=79263 RepID=UPI0036DAAB0D
MKKGYPGRFANDPIIPGKGNVNGKVIEYRLTPEELAVYQKMGPDRDRNGQPLRRTIAQKTRHKGA